MICLTPCYYTFSDQNKSRNPFEDIEAEIWVDVFKGKIPCINQSRSKICH